MGSSIGRTILCVTIAVAVLTACAGSSGVPNAASSLDAAQNRVGQKASSVALSGEYVGKFHDSLNGTSRLRLYLSQSQNVLGGALINARGSQGLAAAIVWVANGNTISGNGISHEPSGFCTFSMSVRHKYRRLNGTYSATYGCAGQSGTFSLWHKCYVPITGSQAIRPESGVKPC